MKTICILVTLIVATFVTLAIISCAIPTKLMSSLTITVMVTVLKDTFPTLIFISSKIVITFTIVIIKHFRIRVLIILFAYSRRLTMLRFYNMVITVVVVTAGNIGTQRSVCSQGKE